MLFFKHNDFNYRVFRMPGSKRRWTANLVFIDGKDEFEITHPGGGRVSQATQTRMIEFLVNVNHHVGLEVEAGTTKLVKKK
jgi:hypothetical protein